MAKTSNLKHAERERAWRTLWKHREILQLVFDSMGQGVVVADENGKFLLFNRAAEAILGIGSTDASPEEWAQRYNLFLPDWVTHYPAEELPLARAIRGETVREIELCVRHPRAGNITISVTATPLKDEEDGKLGGVAVFRDITERKRAEATLQQSEKRFRSLVAATSQVVWTTDAQGQVVGPIPTWQAYTGQTDAKILGWGWSKALHPGDLERTTGVWKQALEAKSIYDAESRVRRHDGVYRTFAARGVPVLADDGAVQEWVGTCTDITERKQAEDHLAMQARIADVRVSDDQMYDEVLQIILKLMDSTYGVFRYIDENGALVVPSMTRHIWDKCQVRDKTFTFARDTWGDSSWPRAIREKKANYTNEYSGKTPQGHIQVRRHISLPIVFQGEVIGLFQVANKQTDYTDADVRTLESIAAHVAPILNARLQRQRAEAEVQLLNADLEERIAERTAELTASNKELEAFTYSVSHDLRAPLRQIDGFGKILVEEFGAQLNATAQRYLQLVCEGSRKMARLLDDLLELTRLGRQELRRQVTGLNSLVEQVVADLNPEIDGRQIHWQINSLPVVECDPRLMKQVLVNLLSNAVKFTRSRDPAVIEVGSGNKDGQAVIFVRDNGVGFNMKYADKLFGVFQRLHRPQDFEGTGVGLATVQRIIQKHGGCVWAEGEEDKGAVFYLTLGSR